VLTFLKNPYEAIVAYLGKELELEDIEDGKAFRQEAVVFHAFSGLAPCITAFHAYLCHLGN
jgi:hypothetical protein